MVWDIISISSGILALLAVALTYLNYKILIITKDMLYVTFEIRNRTDDLLRVTKKTYESLSGGTLDK